MWNDLSQLRLLGMWLQWLAIALVFVGGFLQLAKFVVDRRERTLSSIEQTERQKPARQLITSGSATVEVVVDSAEEENSHYMDQGGYLIFGKDTTVMMTFSSIDCFGAQNGKREVVWKGIFSLDAHDPAVGQQIGFLKDAEFIQVGFAPMAPESIVKGGTAVITINGVIRFTVKITPQHMDADRIMVRDLYELRKELE